MKLSEISIESDNWNDVVRSFQHYSVFDLKEYYLATGVLNNGTPSLLLFEDNNQRAMITFLVRDIAHESKFNGSLPQGRFFDISSIYGYGGMISDSDFYPVSEYFDYCRNQGFITEFVRFNLFSNYKDAYLGKVESHSNNVVVDLTQPLESIVASYDRKVRKNINTAIRNDLIAIEDSDFQFINEFLRIYYSTMGRNSASNNFYFRKRPINPSPVQG